MRAKDEVVITPYRDGPLLVRGPVRLERPDGTPVQLEQPDGTAIDQTRDPIALCRCGKSRMRPFCDGTHKLSVFRAP